MYIYLLWRSQDQKMFLQSLHSVCISKPPHTCSHRSTRLHGNSRKSLSQAGPPKYDIYKLRFSHPLSHIQYTLLKRDKLVKMKTETVMFTHPHIIPNLYDFVQCTTFVGFFFLLPFFHFRC